jgi:hypothetical protein
MGRCRVSIDATILQNSISCKDATVANMHKQKPRLYGRGFCVRLENIPALRILEKTFFQPWLDKLGLTHTQVCQP